MLKEKHLFGSLKTIRSDLASERSLRRILPSHGDDGHSPRLPSNLATSTQSTMRECCDSAAIPCNTALSHHPRFNPARLYKAGRTVYPSCAVSRHLTQSDHPVGGIALRNGANSAGSPAVGRRFSGPIRMYANSPQSKRDRRGNCVFQRGENPPNTRNGMAVTTQACDGGTAGRERFKLFWDKRLTLSQVGRRLPGCLNPSVHRKTH